ncbi:carbohydrate ABC transporter permease [Nonomuraea muscovyensis]|jgi:raffinose/stachyose/melibiose transport system permease protein|uniref:Raffinose/stachyose/melibiose transport system permease protein n=1 Tax=Nonomuraea muscovyensis TaxID=1124761 RepID=A0A7X0C512_9ACTN|nr:carbohydrate ABC transporter permease [Nonomuraea muscovyensis]MBB6348263.1 raffinose/stachyose/melibiose transport system permease protein [Nonomuraea muscovyensis]MDF2709692.1 transporter permease subunit [Nonomuraea muscovyensis]
MITAGREAWTGRLLLILMMAVTLLPFLSLFVTALHPSGTYPAGLAWPDDPQWDNFLRAFEAANMGELLKSSVLIVLGVVPVSILLGTMAGFAIGHLRVIGGRVIFLLFVLGLTLPFEGIITPLYYQIRDMGLLNTRWAIILPLIGLFMPFSVFWMRAHFVNMPGELSESARMDGANVWQLFRRIHVPLAMPAISSLGILLFLWTWNQFLLAIVLVDDPAKRTMSGALGAFQGQWGTDIPLLCAGSLLILTPTLVIFLIFQRHFVKALLQGSLKG